VGHDEVFQRLTQRRSWQFRSRFGSLAHVLAAHVSALDTTIPTHSDQQGRRPPAERFVRKPSTPPVIVDDPASQDRALGLKVLAYDFQAEFIKACERGQIRTNESSAGHLEVVQIGECENFHLRKASALTHRPRSTHHHTIDCEKPVKAVTDEHV